MQPITIGNYEIGKFSCIDMYVDPNMSWTDMRIIFKKDEEIVKEIEVIDDDMILL